MMTKTRLPRQIIIITLFLVVIAPSQSQVNILTQHNDYNRTGWNKQETVLNTQNVSPLGFGKQFEYPVSGQVYAQPLYMSGLDIPGKGRKNVLFVATMHNNVYAFDADDKTLATQPYWQINLGASVPLPDPLIGKSCGDYNDIKVEIGILSTPVIDTVTNTIYVVAKTKENGNYIDRVHALDIRSGQAKFGSPKQIDGTTSGTGVGGQNGVIRFLPVNENQRSALTIVNGILYICYAGYCDTPPYHGWIFGYAASDLQQQRILFNTTPNGDEGGIWMAGQGPAVDANGDLYVITGNGKFDPSTNDYGDCFLRLRPKNGTLEVVDYFAPYNQDYLDQIDADLGSDGPLLIPGTDLVTGSGKEGVVYLLKQNNFGKFNATQDACWQRFKTFDGHLHGSSVYWGDQPGAGLTYWWSENDNLKSFRIDNTGRYNPAPTAAGPHAPQGMPGGMLSLSSDGNKAGTGILWVNIPIAEDANHATVDGMLRAFDASDVSKELWNSQQIVSRDGLGKFAKFCAPTVANGRVYMSTFSNKIVVYGLVNNTPIPLREPENPANTANGLDYTYHEGSWNQLPNFDVLAPEKRGVVPYLNFSEANRLDNFAFRYTGYLNIPTDGFYTFYLNSDDGSKFYIGDVTVINNNGLHAAQELTGWMGLKAGKHAITVEFFEKGGDQVLTLSYQGPGLPKQLVPQTALFRIDLKPDDIIIRPNPAYSEIHILAGNNIVAGTGYSIFNSAGQLIEKGNLKGIETSTTVSQLPAGVYYVRVATGKRGITRRFVKM
jgi:PA14 domain/Secretion system C-terminal sorting domain